jgi:hypothetical protein
MSGPEDQELPEDALNILEHGDGELSYAQGKAIASEVRSLRHQLAKRTRERDTLTGETADLRAGLFTTEKERDQARQEAEETAAAMKGMVVVERAGESTRCKLYCRALPFCRQGKWLVAPQDRVQAETAG